MKERKKSLRKEGTTIHEKGYIRITAGPWRHRYLHRIIAGILWDIKYHEPLPDRIEVHHLDGNPLHDCPQNYLLCDAAIHDAFSAGREKVRSERKAEKLVRRLRRKKK